MNTIYHTGTGRVQVDETGKVSAVPNCTLQCYVDVNLIEDPTKYVYEHNGEIYEVYAEQDDVVLRFYKENFPALTVIRDEKLVNALKIVKENEQKAKEKWAQQRARVQQNNNHTQNNGKEEDREEEQC